MNLKKTLLFSAAISTVTIAAIISLGYLNASQASKTTPAATDTVAQALPEETAEDGQERVIPLPYMTKGKAIYMLNDPAIQFDYDPNFFVLEVLETPSETAGSASEPSSPLVSSIRLWLKEDYMTLKNAGDELGDFPTRLKLSVYENPEGLPVEDWITTQASFIFQSEIEDFGNANITIANQEAWAFSYTSLFRYNNIAFKDTDGRVVVLSIGLDQSPNERRDAHYGTARAAMIESIELLEPVSN